jgi:hypothetical protein
MKDYLSVCENNMLNWSLITTANFELRRRPLDIYESAVVLDVEVWSCIP